MSYIILSFFLLFLNCKCVLFLSTTALLYATIFGNVTTIFQQMYRVQEGGGG